MNSPRNLRKKVRKNYSEMLKDEYMSALSPHQEYERQNQETNEFKYCLTDFDCCRIIENKVATSCEIAHCSHASSKPSVTKFACNVCKVACCLDCYDIHHQEKMRYAVKTFCSTYTPDIQMLVSEAGFISIKPDTSTKNWITKPSLNIPKNILNDLQSLLKKQFIEIHSNEIFNCIFFQDKQMKDFFHYYPEYMSVDVVCEILELELTLYLFVCEDCNSHCEIVAACLLKTSDENTLSWLWDVFKKCNADWSKIKVILFDKQLENMDTIKQFFPDAMLLNSFFHSMKEFKLTLSDLGIEKAKRISAIKVFENMVTSTDNNEYQNLVKELEQISPEIATYFEQHWCEKDTWKLGSMFSCKIFLTPMSKFLCLIQKKMKTSLNAKKSLDSIIKSFVAIIFNLRKEKYESLSSVFQPITVISHIKSPQYKYIKYLTYYSAKIVLNQMNISSEVRNIQKISSGKYTVVYHDITVNVSTTSCSCNFYNIVCLPCCHIFALRKFLSLPLFLETFCNLRWTSKFYFASFLSLHASFMSQNSLENVEKQYSESHFQKYFELCEQLVPLMANDVKKSMIMDFLLDIWQHNIKVSVKIPENSTAFGNKEIEFDSSYSIDHLKNLYGVSGDEYSNSDVEFSAVSLYSENTEDELYKCLTNSSVF